MWVSNRINLRAAKQQRPHFQDIKPGKKLGVTSKAISANRSAQLDFPHVIRNVKSNAMCREADNSSRAFCGVRRWVWNDGREQASLI